ncbi:MAG TPA: nuclear transport factor 2 family protein [Longimicrobiales bacterium]
MPDARAALEMFLDAIEARDAQRMLDALADDVTLEAEVLRTPIRGKQTFADLLAGAPDTWEEARIDRRMVVASGRHAAALIHVHVRFAGDAELLGETLPTAGKELSMMGALFAEVDDAGKISRLIRVWDLLGVMRQLDLSPEHLLALARKFEERMAQRRPRAA